MRRAGDRVEAMVLVRNEGLIEADEVAQLYVSPPGKAAERPAPASEGLPEADDRSRRYPDHPSVHAP